MILLNLLVSQNIISELEAKALEREYNEANLPIDELLDKHNISQAAVMTARNAIYNIPIYNGPADLIDNDVYTLLDRDKSEKYLAIPLGLDEDEDGGTNKHIKNKVLIGIVDPERNSVLDALQFIMSGAGVTYRVYLISLNEFKRRFEAYSVDGVKAVPTYTTKIEESEEDDSGFEADLSEEDAAISQSLINSAPIQKIVNVFIKNAIDNNASDIHIEHMGDHVRVRNRVDGTLNLLTIVPSHMHLAVVARVKILCDLRIDEKRKPQDGRFSVKYNGHKIDFRVSTMPGYYGEKVVIRILDSHRGVKKLEDIGLSAKHLSQIRGALERPYGIVLISGPTGSGKSTTLYSMLNEVDKEKKNVVSLEDPIEYNIPGMNQSQVFPEIGYTFATGLRSILRQDPDVIMVGEIRDAETAQLAIQAALTGHLVFSTIHTNNATGVITRLKDMGVDPFLIAPTIILAVAQRLVHRIAPGAEVEITDPGIKEIIKESFKDLPEEYKKDLSLDSNPHNAGPVSTNPSGIKGRIPVFEILEMDNDIEELVIKNASEDDIRKLARQKGMITMHEDAMIKSIRSTVPFTEVNSL